MDYSFCYFDLGNKEKSDELKEKAKLIAENIHGSETEKILVKSFDAANDQDKGEIFDMVKNIEKCYNKVNIFGEENYR